MAGTAGRHARLSVTRTRRGALGGLGVALVALVPAPPSGAGGDYQATASADGIRVGVAVRRFLVVEQIADVGGPSAQAHVDSLGNSHAWSAYPFPGDLVIAVPGTVAGFGPPGLPTLPAYPLYASATYPTRPSSEVGGSGYTLRANAEERVAAAEAQAGAATDQVRIGVTRSAATARRSTDSAVEAAAESTVDAFTVGDVLRIGRVASRAGASVRPGGAVTRDSETTIADVTIAGQAVVIGQRGITTPGGQISLPDDSPVRRALTDAGVTVRYLAPEDTAGGVIAAGVEVSLIREVSGVGEAVVTYVLGRASAAAEAAGEPVVPPLDGTVPVGPEPPGPDGGAVGHDDTAGAADASGSRPADAGVVAGGGRIFGGYDAPESGVSGSAGSSVPGATGSPAPPPGGAAPSGLPTGEAPPVDGAAAVAEDATVFGSAPAGTVTAAPDFSGFVPVLVAGGALIAVAFVMAGRLMRRASWTL